MALTVTSLTHPTMIAKIRLGLKYAALGQGDKMNGHGTRVYIANAKGNNILRLNWLGGGKFIAYGSESRDVTEMVKEAMQRACKKANPSLSTQAYKLALVASLSVGLTGCQVSGGMTVVYSVLGSVLT